VRTSFSTVYGTKVSVTLTAAAEWTRVVVTGGLDTAWIKHGRCPSDPMAHGAELTATPRLRLHAFYSFRSSTLLAAPLSSLLRTPHMLLVDAGGAHGGNPIGCVDLHRSNG
jgi:hypothetical protein